MKNFFRSDVDGGTFPNFTIYHILLILVVFLSVYILYKNLHKFSRNKILYTLMGLLLIDRLIMFLWFYLNDFYTLKESLPLYTCRAAVYICLLYLITKNNIIKTIAVYWSIAGASVAFVYIDLYRYQFPHYTNFSYIIYHTLVIMIGISIVVKDGFEFNKKSINIVLIFTTIFMIILRYINTIIDANYSHIMSPPIAKNFFSNMNSIQYFIFIVFCIYNLMFYLLYLIAKKITS